MEAESDTTEGISVKKSRSMKNKLFAENNNSYWNLGFEEMLEMGVEVLSYSDDENPSTRSEPSGEFSSEEDGVNPKKQKMSPDKFVIKNQKPPSQTNKDLFSLLSDEIALSIFRHMSHSTLATVACVCQRFSRLVRDESLWKRLDLGSKLLPYDTLGYVLSRGIKILRLASARVEHPAFRETEEQLRYLNAKLEYLDLSECDIHIEDLKKILSKCRMLKKISFESCELSEDILLELSENEGLETLNLCLCTGLTPNGLVHVFRNCRMLKEINLGWASLTKECVDVICRFCPSSLTEINLSGCQVTMTDSDLERLVTRCVQLTELDVSDCIALTEAAVKLIVRNLPRLKILSISRCFRIRPLSVVPLRSMPKLQKINMYKTATEKDVTALETLLPGVKFNTEPFSSVARPTVGIRRTSIWGIRCRD